MSSLGSKYKKLVKQIERALVKSIVNHEQTLKPEVIKATPKREGDLRGSYKFAETEESKAAPDMIQYQIKFGSPETVDPVTGENYAASMHEWPTLRSKDSHLDKGPKKNDPDWTTPGTGPKFLQEPTLRTAPDWLKRVQSEYKKVEQKYPGGSK